MCNNLLCIICLMTLCQDELSDKVLQVFSCKLGDKLPPGPLYRSFVQISQISNHKFTRTPPLLVNLVSVSVFQIVFRVV